MKIVESTRTRTALFAACLAACFAASAHAADAHSDVRGPRLAALAARVVASDENDYETKRIGQRYFGLLASAGFFSGFSGGVQLGTQDVGVRALAGYSPVLIAIQESSTRGELKFFSGYLLAPDLFVSLLPAADWARVGAECGYRYHSLLGHGLALGGFGAFRISRKLEGTVFGGLLVFPHGEDELRRQRPGEIPPGVDTVFPGANVNWGVNVGLSLFP